MLERVQRFYTNRIPGCTFRPYSQRLSILSLQSLQFRRTISDIVCLYALITGDYEFSLVPYLIHIPPSITRGHNLKIFPPNINYVRSKQNFLSRTIPLWNSLPISVFSATSRYSFRKKVSKYLTDP